MIRTLYKAKLPNDLSYPIGAEAISAALGGASHFDSLELSFSVYAGIFASDFRKKLAEGRPITIATIDYQHEPVTLKSANDSIARGWHDERWSLRVYSVPRSCKAVARQALEKALPKIGQWLNTPRDDVWRYGSHRLAVMVHLPDGEVVFHEAD